MSLKLGDKNIPSIYLGGRKVTKIFKGNRVVYPSSSGGNPTVTIIGNLPNNTTSCGYLGVSPDSNYIALCNGANPYARVWQRTGATTFKSLTFNGSISSARGIAFTNNKMYVGTAQAPYFFAYDIVGDNVNPITATYPIDFSVYAIGISPNGQYMGIGGLCGPGYGYVFKKNASTGEFEPLTQLTAVPFKSCYEIAWDSTSTYMIAVCNNGSKLISYRRTGDTFEKVQEFSTSIPNLQSGSFLGSNKFVVGGAGTTTYQMFSFYDGTFVADCSIELLKTAEDSLYLAVCPDNIHVAYGTPANNGLRFFKLEGNILKEYSTTFNSNQEARSVIWSPDNTYICSGGNPLLSQVTS